MALKSYGGRGRGRSMERRENVNDELRKGKIRVIVLIMI